MEFIKRNIQKNYKRNNDVAFVSGLSKDSSNNSGTNIPSLSNKLDKSVWDEHFYLDENGNLHSKKNFVSDLGLTSYGKGYREVATIMNGVVTDETTITKEDGKLKVIGGTSGGASNWDELEGKPTWITDEKPSYSWNEITSKPSTFTPSSHTHSEYVNKAGDTMTGNLTLPRINIKGTSNSDAYISADATNNMYISLADEVIVNFNPITLRPSLVKNGVVSLGSTESRWNELFTNGLTVNKSVSSYLSNNNPVGINCTNTNPYLGFFHNDKKWYVQAYNNNLHLGVTANQSVKIDENGKLNAAGGLSSSSSTILQFDKYAYKDVLKYGWTSAEGDYIDWKLPGTSEPKYVRLSHNKGLQAFCNILSTGGITCYTSDERLKNKIEDISLSLEDIANSPTIKFRWNNTKIKDDEKTHIGGIAQYTQKILPEAVIESDEMLNMDYATTAYIFAVQTAKHLQDINNKLLNKIDELEKKITDLNIK